MNEISIKNVGASALGASTDFISQYLSQLDDSDFGRIFGSLFSSGLGSVGNTISNNLVKGNTLSQGLGQNAGASLLGTASGLASNYLGQGISSLGGNSPLSRGIGQGIATGVGTIGGTIATNLAKTGSVGTLFANTTKAANLAEKFAKSADAAKQAGDAIKFAADGKKAAEYASKISAINPIGLASSVVGQGLSAAFGPSKEYNGTYGNITQGMDTAYDVLSTAINFVPGWGQIASGAMALNKGLSNVFGSTSGMTVTDSILGSAFMPFPIKWINMWGAKTTDKFKGQSWQRTEKTNSFMQDAFGDLGKKFDLARREQNKTYGTFSRSAYNKAQDNVNFSNNAWGTILDMTNQNEYQNIRANDMASINNQRYAQMIQGGFSPIAVGKQGMKILNNQTNHNIGQRLLSGAALIDNKQMILSAKGGIKVKKKDDHTYEMEPLQEITVTAPRKYIAGYDQNGNPIYTTNRTKSMSYEGVRPSESKYQRWANRDKNAPKYTDPIIKAAQIGIGTPLAVTTAPATLGTLFKASTPLMEVLARPITTATKVASRLFPNLSRALPYTEMADRGLMGYMGARGMYDAGKGWYQGKMPWYQAVPQMGLSGLMMTEAVPLVNGAAKNLPQFARRVWNGGNIIQRNIPYNPYNFYRGVGRAAIDDANKSGILRGGAYDSPYFGLGHPAWHEGYVIEGTQNSANWLRAKGPRGEYNVGDFIGANEYAKPGYTGLEALPWNGTTTQVPTTGFTYWQKHPIIGWRNHSFSSRGSIEPTITPENAASITPIPKSGMKPFIDDYGREVIPTPWKGTDQQLIDLIQKNQVNVLRDYFSPQKKEQIMKAMNWGEKEYSEFQDELMRSIGTLTEGEVKGTKDGFTIIAQHKGEALGEGKNMTGHHIMTFNRERIPNEKMATEAIIHEIGGHGKTMSINPNKPNKISEAFPRITQLLQKNQELADNILELNGRGKFFSQFPKVSDLELYVYNNNIPKHKVEKLFNQRRYFNYMTNGIQERAARAYTGQLMDKLGFNKTLNIQQLERYYTPESVEKFKNAVLNYGVPVTVGGSTAATLHNKSK